jgi:hypothetical protein
MEFIPSCFLRRHSAHRIYNVLGSAWPLNVMTDGYLPPPGLEAFNNLSGLEN